MVKLESIELAGFKSFGQKLKLVFDKELTVIVGPNGSGKSNIVDAVLWTLGERENKNLRIHKNEDLIFANPETKNKSGLAWVKLIIKDGKELIEIKRKINREGLSVSFLGERKVPLKDLIEYLAKKKIGAKGLNIIRQGESEKFIQANSFERRLLLENVLGVKAYQIKRHQAQLKLAQTNQHLEQAKIAFSELGPRYRSLRWQLSRYEKREEIENRLKEKELEYLTKKYALILHSQEKDNKILEEKTLKEIEQLKKEKESLNILKQKNERLSQTIRNEKQQLLNQKEILTKRKNELFHELGKLEGASQIYQEKNIQEKQTFSKKEIESFIEKIRQAFKNLLSLEPIEIKEKLAQILDFIENEKNLLFKTAQDKPKINQDQYQEIIKKQKDLKAKIAILSNQESQLDNKIKQKQNILAKTEKEYYQLWQKITQIQESIFNKKNFLAKQNSQKVVLEEKKKEVEEEIAESGLNKLDIEKKVKESINLKIIPEEIKHLKDSIFRLKSQLASIGEINQEFIDEAKLVEKRYNFLKKEIEDLESAKEKLSKLIKDLEQETEKIFNQGIKKINDQLEKISDFIFPKGKIKLKNYKKLTPEEEKNALEIEIIWKNKTIRNINILSGGEKTLIALAILTSISLSCQPPFIILDEIDAALDADNSKKIAEILAEISKYTQTILITHNQITAKSAKIIYGIIMSKGTSKAISYKF